MREFLGFRRVWGALIVPLLFTTACDDDDRVEGAGSGGASSQGGEPSAGGAEASGGDTSSGGTSGSGGTASTGGGKASGGTSGSGGTSASGGASSGGASSGGTSSGGTSSGGTSSGGTSGSGGASSGGTSGSGGAPVDSGDDAAPDAPFDAGPEGGDAATPIITVSLDKSRVALRAGNSVTFVATVSGDPNNAGVDWTVTGGGVIDAAGVYTAAANAASGVAVVTAKARADASESASAQVLVVQPGAVTSSGHPLVAAYAITPPEAATVRVQFGTDVAYEKETSEVPAPAGASSSRLVAGMPAATLHHLRAVLTFGDGLEYLDADHSFTTGALPAGMPVLTSTIETGKTPTPGIELINSTSRLVTASDLAGNILWYYEHPAGTVPTSVGSVNLLPNGNFVSIIAPSSTLPLSPSVGTYLNVVREYDLAGNTVRELTGDQLNTRLSQAATSGCTECDFTNEILHHEVRPLPNGHFLVLGNTLQTCGASTGCTGDPAEMVLGDVIIDLDQNLNPVWAWNAFNHVPVDRSAFLFPDWTQSNSLAYSPSDGSLLLSSRHLSWILKIAYANGTGNGNVIWRLGLGGDFTLQGGEEPNDWFNAQHTPSFTTSVTTGVFPLMVFDNGTYRQFSASNPCGTVALPCSYSTVPTFEIDESAKTATLVSNLRSPIYSRAGGNAEVLPGGNVHFTAAASAQDESDVYEYTGGPAPALVMHLNIKGQNAYRSRRLGSLYPDITW